MLIFFLTTPKSSNDYEADGMIEEFNISKKQNTFIIPIAATGYASKTIMNEIKNHPNLKTKSKILTWFLV